MSTEKTLSYLTLLAFATVYFVWGSTYLANEYAIDHIPPILMAGSRFTIAGVILIAFARLTNWQSVTATQWRNLILTGLLFITLGIGGTIWAQQFIDSGMTALLTGMNPAVVVLLSWLLFQERSGWKAGLGLLLGMTGLFLLISQNGVFSISGSEWGIAVILFATLAWAYGSVILSKLDLPVSKIQTTGLQLFCGGMILLVLSTINADYAQVNLFQIPLISWLAWGYLIIFGSILAFLAFNYLLLNVAPAKVSTYSYVNPVIAVFLGWWFRDELLTAQTLVAAATMLLGVYFINQSKVVS